MADTEDIHSRHVLVQPYQPKPTIMLGNILVFLVTKNTSILPNINQTSKTTVVFDI